MLKADIVNATEPAFAVPVIVSPDNVNPILDKLSPLVTSALQAAHVKSGESVKVISTVSPDVTSKLPVVMISQSGSAASYAPTVIVLSRVCPMMSSVGIVTPSYDVAPDHAMICLGIKNVCLTVNVASTMLSTSVLSVSTYVSSEAALTEAKVMPNGAASTLLITSDDVKLPDNAFGSKSDFIIFTSALLMLVK